MTTIKQYSDIKDLVYFVIKNYPYKGELSKARLTKIIFLMDWKSSIDYWTQITSINWYFDSYWPYVKDVVRVADSNPNLFKKIDTINLYFNSTTIIRINDNSYDPVIQNEIKVVYNFIVDKTKMLNFNDFINFVYSTYPIQISSRYSYLDLPQLAQEYKLN